MWFLRYTKNECCDQQRPSKQGAVVAAMSAPRSGPPAVEQVRRCSVRMACCCCMRLEAFYFRLCLFLFLLLDISSAIDVSFIYLHKIRYVHHCTIHILICLIGMLAKMLMFY